MGSKRNVLIIKLALRTRAPLNFWWPAPGEFKRNHWRLALSVTKTELSFEWAVLFCATTELSVFIEMQNWIWIWEQMVKRKTCNCFLPGTKLTFWQVCTRANADYVCVLFVGGVASWARKHLCKDFANKEHKKLTNASKLCMILFLMAFWVW